MKTNHRYLFLAAFSTLTVACTDGMHSMSRQNYTTQPFSSNGERIYYTGTSDSNQAISVSGGHHHMQMHGGGCVTCHGEEREGGVRMWPWFWKAAPALTSEKLLGDHQDDGHTHAVYDKDSLKRAIADGVNPEGEQLDELMPRWQMSKSDLDDLVSYLLDGYKSEKHEHDNHE